jgi:arginase
LSAPPIDRSDELRLLCSPFHNGLQDVGTGVGARTLAEDEQLGSGLEALGWHVNRGEIEAVDESGAEMARVIELIRRLQAQVQRASAQSAFPLVLAGNCNSSLATTAGIGTDGLGVIWFDAHADFDDPDDNLSGFLDVMALAMLTGRGWATLRATIPGHAPIPESSVILAGARDLEPYQRARTEGSDLAVVPNAIDMSEFERAVADLSRKVSRVYVHLDLDVVDSSVARVNEYAAGGGPSVERVSECLDVVRRAFRVEAAAITAYDPACDRDGSALGAARSLARDLVGARSDYGELLIP